MSQTLLSIQDLRAYYPTSAGPVKAVDGATFVVHRGERFGLVGESGCGKSTTAIAILRLLAPVGVIEGGHIYFDGTDLVRLPETEMRRMRWQRISFIPQGAMNSLNPVMRIHDQIADGITAHENHQPRRELKKRIETLLGTVGLSAHVAGMFPHELSGGMKQRVCIAMAVSLSPQLIIADEPTSALDVIVQRVVTQTLISVQEKLGASLILIGHDMGLQAQIVDRLAVMYGGRIVEVADVREIYHAPLHPYTQALITFIPSVREKKPPKGIPGLPPLLLNPPSGCVFHPRCQFVMEKCKHIVPELREVQPGHFVACHLQD